jgi:uncharacterized damage-inducible protein DinB
MSQASRETSRLIDELNRAIEGDTWHGDSIALILEGVQSEQASARPIAGAHSIWEIVRHMTAWTGEAARRLAGHPAGEPQEGDWPSPSGTGQAAWRDDVTRLLETHRRLIAMLESFDDEQILEPTSDPRNRQTGVGVTHYVLLHGLAQHHAYHGGQIALLKRAASASPPR